MVKIANLSISFFAVSTDYGCQPFIDRLFHFSFFFFLLIGI